MLCPKCMSIVSQDNYKVQMKSIAVSGERCSSECHAIKLSLPHPASLLHCNAKKIPLIF